MVTANFISVILPCYNAAAYVEEAVESVFCQSHQALEVIAVDDGSTDDSLLVLQRLARADSRLRVFSQPNRGPSAARNAALRHARGAFLCFLDADDAFLPDKLRNQFSAFQYLPAADLVYSDYFLGDSTLTPTGFVPTCIPGDDLLAAFARRNWFAPMCPLLRRALLDRVGPFDEAIFGSEDWDFWIRCALVGRFSYLPGPVAVYRFHPSQLHTDSRRMDESARRVAAKHFPPGSRLHHLSAACLRWSDAKDSFRAGRYGRTFTRLLQAEYHSLRAGGLSLSARDANTIVLPPAVGGAAASNHFAHPGSALLHQ